MDKEEDVCHACGQKVEDRKTNFRVPYVHAVADSSLVEIFHCDENDQHSKGQEAIQLEKPEVLQFIEWLRNSLDVLEEDEGDNL